MTCQTPSSLAADDMGAYESHEEYTESDEEDDEEEGEDRDDAWGSFRFRAGSPTNTHMVFSSEEEDDSESQGESDTYHQKNNRRNETRTSQIVSPPLKLPSPYVMSTKKRAGTKKGPKVSDQVYSCRESLATGADTLELLEQQIDGDTSDLLKWMGKSAEQAKSASVPGPDQTRKLLSEVERGYDRRMTSLRIHISELESGIEKMEEELRSRMNVVAVSSRAGAAKTKNTAAAAAKVKSAIARDRGIRSLIKRIHTKRLNLIRQEEALDSTEGLKDKAQNTFMTAQGAMSIKYIMGLTRAILPIEAITDLSDDVKLALEDSHIVDKAVDRIHEHVTQHNELYTDQVVTDQELDDEFSEYFSKYYDEDPEEEDPEEIAPEEQEIEYSAPVKPRKPRPNADLRTSQAMTA